MKLVCRSIGIWRSQHHGERKRDISKTAALAGNKFKAKYGWMTLRTAEDGVIWCHDFAYSCIPPSERNPSYSVTGIHLGSAVTPLEIDY